VQFITPRYTVQGLHKMASIQEIESPLTKEISYRAQVRVKWRASESATFSSKKKAAAWAKNLESAIEEGRHFPHAAARRTSFDALAKAYIESALDDFDEKQRATRTQQLTWWAERFKGLILAEIARAKIAEARDVCAAEKFTRGKPHKDKDTGEMIPPKEYKRTPAPRE
jgi:hypothetical protein